MNVSLLRAALREEAIGNLDKGKTLSQETKTKIRKSALSRVKPTLSEEAL